MSPAAFLELFGDQRASAILRTSDCEAARGAMDAAVRGGFRVLEFTLSVPGALELISEFSQRPGLAVGAGTVLTCEEANRCVEAGAQFIVSPVVDEEVIAEAARLGVAAMPGCATPTEMLRAHRAGAQLQKLFPVAGPGAAWVLQTRGPMPFLNIVPTSGVTPGNMTDYLDAGAFALGFVNSLFIPEEVLGAQFDKIEARSKQIFETLAQWHGEPGAGGR